MGHRHDLVLGEIARLRDPRMLLQIARRRHHDTADLADPHRHHRRIREVADAKRDVDALLDQVDRAVEQQELCRHRRVGVEERIEDRTQDHLA